MPHEKRPKHLGEVVANDTNWWGMSWQLSNAGTQRLILAVKGGASLSTIVSLFCAGSVIGVACGVAYGVAAVLLFLGADILDFCNRYGRGIVLAKPWVGMPYCKSR